MYPYQDGTITDLQDLRLQVAAIRIKIHQIQLGTSSLISTVLVGCECVDRPEFTADLIGKAPEVMKLAHSAMREIALGAALSASIVYAHAMCEAILMDICAMISYIAPDDFLYYIRDKRVSFDDLRNSTAGQLQASLTERFLVTLGRDPLVKKVHVLFSILKPETTEGVIPDFSYDESVLKEIDEFRHRCVHKPEWMGPPSDFERTQSRIQFLCDLSALLLQLTITKYTIPEL